jgi:hypothetical protein
MFLSKILKKVKEETDVQTESVIILIDLDNEVFELHIEDINKKITPFNY